MKKIETIEELEKALDEVDFSEVHKERLFLDRGYSVWLYWDGEKVSHEIEAQGTIPGPGNTLFAIFKCDLNIGPEYSEGWAKYDGERDIYIADDGRELSREEMAMEAIENGDYSDAYNFWKEEIRNEFWEEQRHGEYDRYETE